MKVDFSKTEEKSFSPVPAGTYKLQVVTAEEKVKDESGAWPYLNVQFSVVDEEYANRRIFQTMTTKPDNSANFLLLAFLKALGYTDDEVRSADFDFDPEEFVGITVNARVGIKKSEGYDDQNNIKSFL